jgi:SAM-dependent methyltransferase
MTSALDPYDILFGGMERLSPGGRIHTLNALAMLPPRLFDVIVDAGCGTGAQTLVLARALERTIHAVDVHEPFLVELRERAEAAGLAHLVETHCMDMADVPQAFPRIDLLWSEGAAYAIGFPNALRTWATAVVPGGFAVVSDLVWLKDDAPAAVKDFLATGYPEMVRLEANLAVAESAGYRVHGTYTLPPEAWTQGYYDELGPRATVLLAHADEGVRALAQQTLREIEIFEQSEGSYGYVTYVLERRG